MTDGLESITDIVDSSVVGSMIDSTVMGSMMDTTTVNSTGVVKSYVYDTFGNMVSETGELLFDNPFHYTGRQFDAESGLYYYRARYYDPQIVRFISEDPIGLRAGPNFYIYVNNNPVNFRDPSGMRGSGGDSCCGTWFPLGATNRSVFLYTRGCICYWICISDGDSGTGLYNGNFFDQPCTTGSTSAVGSGIQSGGSCFCADPSGQLQNVPFTDFRPRPRRVPKRR